MIYNLVELLRNQFPAETIYINGRSLLAGQENIPDRNILVTDTGGTEKPWILRSDVTVQIITRDADSPKAGKMAMDIFYFLTSRFGLILPQITIDGDLYPQIHTAKITAIQRPYFLGVDEEGRSEYTTNYIVFFER